MNRTCNLNCAYCIQKKVSMARDCGANGDKLNDIIRFVKGIIKRRTSKEPLFLTFYGGEPMLSFQNVQKVVESIDSSKVYFDMVTNGKLLSERTVEYFNKHDMHVAVSWDGAKTAESRGYDVLVDKKNLVCNIKNAGVSSVIRKGDSVLRRLREIDAFNREYVQTNGHPLEDARIFIEKGIAPDESFPANQMEKDVKDMVSRYVSKQSGMMEARYVQSILSKVERYMHGGRYALDKTVCMRGTMLPILMNGDISGCTNTDERIATIYDKPEAIIKASSACNMLEKLDECLKCEYGALVNSTPACRSMTKLIGEKDLCKMCKGYAKATRDGFFDAMKDLGIAL